MESNQNERQATPRDLLKVVFKRKNVIFYVMCIVLATVYTGLQFQKPPVYDAKVKILILAKKHVDSLYYRDITDLRSTETTITQSEIVKSNPVMERVVKVLRLDQIPLDYEKKYASPLRGRFVDWQVKKLGEKMQKLSESEQKEFLFRNAVKDLKEKIKVDPIKDTDLFTITVTDYEPKQAARLANAVSRSYCIFDLEQQLAEFQQKYGDKHLFVLQLKDNLGKMENNLTTENISNIEAIGPASVKIIEQATAPIDSPESHKKLIFIFAFFFSIFLGITLSFSFESLDSTFKSPQELKKFLSMPLLGYIPKRSKKNLYNQSCRAMAGQICQSMKEKSYKSVIIASVTSTEDHREVISNLALRAAEKDGQSILLIDAGMKKPFIHKIFKAEVAPGLSEALNGKASVDSVIKKIKPNLSILSAGTAVSDPASLLESPQMVDLIKAAEKKFDYILICGCAPVFQADAIILMVSEGKTRKEVLNAFIEPLQSKKANFLGAIYNNRSFPLPKLIYDRA